MTCVKGRIRIKSLVLLAFISLVFIVISSNVLASTPVLDVNIVDLIALRHDIDISEIEKDVREYKAKKSLSKVI